MIYKLEDVTLRPLEPRDLDALYVQRNDPAVASGLGSFQRGFSRSELGDWLERHRASADEIMWAIVRPDDDCCIGHAGLYRIDNRVRTAEFGILIGDPSAWGRGIGTRVTAFALAYGFAELNLRRVSVRVLASNARARQLYESVGFEVEGCLRGAFYGGGQYVDVILMARLREDGADAT